MSIRLRSSLAHALPIVFFAAATPAVAGPVAPFVELPWAPHGASAQARYGAVVAPAGDVNGDGFRDVLVSAPKDEGPAVDAGRVFLYLGSASGLAAAPAWSWSANQAGGATGGAAAAAGDVNGDGFGDVVIGTPQWNAAGPIAMAGKISIFHGSPAGLPAAPTYERLAPTPTANARFGFAIATAGNVNGDAYDDVIVGAPFHTSGGLTARGAAFVIHGGAGGLAAAPALTLLGGQAGANLGRAVSTAGDVDADGFADVVIGAPHASFFGVASGTAALHRGSAAGVIAVADTVLGADSEFDEVGAAVANAGDIDGDGYADVLVGHPGYSNGALNRGRYQLFRGGPGGLQSPPALNVESGNDGERLGAWVTTLGDLNADGYADFGVGAPADSSKVWGPRVLVHLGGPFFFESTQLGSSSAFAAHFGFSLATAGDIDGDGFSEFLVGDPGASVVQDAAEGTAALYELPPTVPALLPEWPVSGGNLFTRRGAALVISPGLDASGYPRLITSEPGYAFGGPDAGIVIVMPGSKDGVSIGIIGNQFGESPGDQFGAALADAGDIDHDGYTDVLIASPTRSGAAGSESGRVSLMRGASGAIAAAVPVLEGDQAFARVGSAIAGRGDVDGDGYHDVLIGAPRWDGPGLTDCGKVWLLYGGPTGFRAGMWTAQGTAANQGLGANVAIGDVDADGYGDVLIASVSPLAISPPSGKVEAYYGGTTGPASSPAWEISSNVPSPTFGAALSAVGDVDDDGICDIAVGAPSEGGTGCVYMVHPGRSRGKPPVPPSIPGFQVGALFGAEIAGGGDVNGDGIGDFVVGEPRFDGGQTDEGRIHLYYGSPAGPQLKWSRESNADFDEFGSAFATLNDVNNDGFADLAVGAPAPQASTPGRAFVFMGGGGVGVGRALSLHQGLKNRFHTARIGPAETAEVSFTLRSAAGRGRTGLQVEAIPVGQPFTGVPTQFTGAVDTGAPSGIGSASDVVSALDLPWMGIDYKVRGRSRSNSPYFPASRWIRPEAHASGDFDVHRGGAEVAVPPWASVAPRLASIAPNPMPTARGAVRIAFDLPRASAVVLDLHDVRGARVRTLVDELRPAGASTATWDGRDERGRLAPAGLYFVRLRADGVVEGGRLVRLP
jgi:hypothetical protein